MTDRGYIKQIQRVYKLIKQIADKNQKLTQSHSVHREIVRTIKSRFVLARLLHF